MHLLIALAVGIGAGGQLRILGGTIGLSMCTKITNNYAISKLCKVLSPSQLAGILESAQMIKNVPSSAQVLVRQAYAEAFNRQMAALTAFSGAALLSALMMVERRPRWQGKMG